MEKPQDSPSEPPVFRLNNPKGDIMFNIEVDGFNPDEIIKNGNKFLIGNGFFGYRGTLEEFSKDQMVAVNLAGFYDQNGTKWRESVNAFNPLYTYLKVQDTVLNPLFVTPIRHKQTLQMDTGTHVRETIFLVDGTKITIRSERFPGQKNPHLLLMRYHFWVDQPILLNLSTGIDSRVYDINGPHLYNISDLNADNIQSVMGETGEKHFSLAVSEAIEINFDFEEQILSLEGMTFRNYRISAVPGKEYHITKYAAIVHSVADPLTMSRIEAKEAYRRGWDALVAENLLFWKQKWALSDVIIKGDEWAQLAIRNSIYHLIIIRPWSEYRGIPARGLSGQVYKGAIFWDTELFMLPFYLNTDLDSARKIIMYRVHTLDGAIRKAKEYGYQGAFYAWESQDTGDDACSDYNVTDPITGEPIRTYFREKQIHITGDIVYAIDQYVRRTKDYSVLFQGGFRMILECARFYRSYVKFSPKTKYYEVPDVIGPDEYHERVNNNAFTNKMVENTFAVLFKTIQMLRSIDPNYCNSVLKENGFTDEIEQILDVYKNLYLPQPRSTDSIIEQFDGYFSLEDVSLKVLKTRVKHQNDYLGGSSGVATPTQIIKQADVVAMLSLFRTEYDPNIKIANWRYYEPRTEHGSSLSASMYALLACENANPEYALPLFLKSASIDIIGEGKQYAGGIYIGGTHPASSGGAYLTAIYGFAGLRHQNGSLKCKSQLPESITELKFKCIENRKTAMIQIKHEENQITWNEDQPIQAVIFDLDGVIVSTDHYHYLAWKMIADREGIEFNEVINNRLRGVSRMESLNIILEKAKREYTQEEKNAMAAVKNAEYVRLLDGVTEVDILPGVTLTLAFLKEKGIRTAVASSSKNCKTILKKINLTHAFNCIVDGNEVSMSKPNPEVFLKAADKLAIDPQNCLVVEDAISGIQAAKAGGMLSAAVSDAKNSPIADWKLDDLSELIDLLDSNR